MRVRLLPRGQSPTGEPRPLEPAMGPEAAMVVMNPENGHVLAMVGDMVTGAGVLTGVARRNAKRVRVSNLSSTGLLWRPGATPLQPS